MTSPAIRLTTSVIANEAGEPIVCDVRTGPPGRQRPVVVICHSFMAFRKWGFFPHAAEALAEAGYISVSFDFSRNGVRQGGDRIEDFDAFASNSFTREIADLGSVVEAVRRGGLAGEAADPETIVLLGHSRGGGIAASYASGDREIAALVGWSSIATFDRWTAHQKAGWRERGYLPLGGSPGVGPLRLGTEILADLDTRLAEIDPVLRAPYITVPWLIVHGKADVTVPAREAEALSRASGSRTTTLRLLDSVGHLSNARDPDEDHYLTLNHVIALTAGWLREVL